jgi:hypothetical protein
VPQQLLQCCGEVGFDAEAGTADLVELGGIDVDVHDLRRLTESLGVASGAVVEARTDRNQQIALIRTLYLRPLTSSMTCMR